MRSTSRIAIGLATLITLTVGAAACSEDGTGHQAATSTAPTPTGTTTTQPSTLPTSVSPAPAETVIEVSVANGRVDPSPDRRVEVAQGDMVRIVVTSDQADEVHVHGYDAEAAVRAGGSATLEFKANQTGSFEVEMHELDPGLLFTLQVS